MHDQINKLRQRWNELTGQDVRERPFERVGYEFLKDFSIGDMEQVVQHMNHNNKKREARFRDVLRFDRILGDPESFEARRSEAAAFWRNRVKPPTEKQKVLSEFRGTPAETEGTGTVRQWGDILKTIKTP